jgi:hypothetical protein
MSAVIVLCGLSAAVVAVLIAIEGQRSAPTTGFTELWALRTRLDGRPAVIFGIISHEAAGTQYRLRVAAGSTTRTESITLSPGGAWQKVQSLPSPRVTVTLRLSKTPGDAVYRRVRLAPS